MFSITGRFGEAEKAVRRAFDLQRSLALQFPNQTIYRSELSQTYIGLWGLLPSPERDEEIQALYREYQAILRPPLRAPRP